MKIVILAGGLGTRISEETQIKPKPMVEIGGKPILWHIMKIYSAHGFNEFVICLGYKGYLIKEYFSKYHLHMSDVTFDMSNNSVEYHKNSAENWKVTLVDTGDASMTGGRIKRIRPYLGDDDLFCMTYGDGLADLDIPAEIRAHEQSGALATLVAVQPPGRYGALALDGDHVLRFAEKPKGDGGWICGGFYVLSPKVLDYIEGDATIWEREPLERLAREGQLHAYRHTGFWKAMDTLPDKQYLENLWDGGSPPWKIW
ncbi:glucose-1-phosphate cytidylyltransferase [Desulfovibrio sp. TomC]|uniref:glucose-1-phosphate cytidylyltransferase n=1 Tax=Desulfovibrio sp. TomC TaxID=1562888 RepID=UPI0005752BC7|nr:glucose-1-phosphate cytidylyltransferase [Desulfovibrio sp. TomC]KHK00279.1 Glucose-1-phosphate cytidylyltransferase [Desulfovibrio sp. TomC]